MSLVQGFLLRIQKYVERGVILSMPTAKSDNRLSPFLNGLFQMMNFSEECFVSMAVYFDRLLRRHNSLISESNMIRLIFISGVLAIKMQDDFSCKNSYFAQISGISSHEINYLEMNFLQWIEYRLLVNSEEYEKYYASLTNY
jgi:hypothetical protein